MPGVGPKMAHLFLQCADDQNTSGIGVDVHVHRIVQRFEWVPKTVKGPEDTRKVLESWLPQKHWSEINEVLVGFGQTICTPRHPKCELCPANSLCPSAFKECSAPKTVKGKLRREKSRTLSHDPKQVESLVEKDPVSRCAEPPTNASADDLLDLCGGSSEVLLQRGWLPHSLPTVSIPENLQRRLSNSMQHDDNTPAKQHRTEKQYLPIPPAHSNIASKWMLADIEETSAAQPRRKSKYFM
jgi:hypothetical protein